MTTSRTWSLISLEPEARQYGGNTGYSDEVQQVYRYDSSVANHKQLAKGDLVFIRDSKHLLGVARIESISASTIQKTRRRCPVCGQTGIKRRKSNPVPWRCTKGHEFQTPVEEVIDIVGFEARYEQSFVQTPKAVPISDLKAAAIRPNDQLSIEELDLSKIEQTLLVSYPQTRALIEHFLHGYVLPPSEADSAADASSTSGTAFIATMTDTRESVLRSIRVRRGQKKFRDQLIRRYGACCLASGCELMDIIEAAHIDPFRDANDHHPENGLLLRADLHTLFDLNLMGIEPDALTLHFPKQVRNAGYQSLENSSLQLTTGKRPAHAPLARRWEAYLAHTALVMPQ